MSNAVTKMPTTGAVERTLIQGDLSQLNENERLGYYKNVCESLGLNPLTQPFAYIKLSGKLTLYAKRDAADQLRKLHSISIQITQQEKLDELYVVTAKARFPDGREDQDMGAVSVAGLKGEALANAMLKAVTKAKRRVTLSICGLGMLDETEVESIAQTERDVSPPAAAPALLPQVEQSNDHGLGAYVMSYGKYKNQALMDIDAHELAGYLDYLEKGAATSGKTPGAMVAESMRAIKNYLGESFE